GNFCGQLTAVRHAQQSAVGHFADDYSVESPLFEYVEDFALAALFGNQQHALLRFAEHDFVRRHACFTLRNFREIDLNAGAATRTHFRERAGWPPRAHILYRDDRARLHRFQASFEQQLLHEWVADLYVGPFL